ncbi:MAG: PQQ-dependent sugar dehydrogenase, partial [Pseudomonadales bacterium]|nr:PQQ-dependent sugar dehydrogenase [Pseudomonadales bacterium]
MSSRFNYLIRPALLAASMLLLSQSATAQFGAAPLGDGPWDLQSFQAKINVSVVARGLEHPWSFAFLPNGDLLITEREGRLRLMHDGVLAPEPIAGMPAVHAEGLLGFMEVLPHPDFAQNQQLYLTYHKLVSAEPKAVAFVLASARLNGTELTDVKELLVSDTWDGAGGAAARLAYGTDGKLYMSLGATRDGSGQEPGSLRGKILRLNDDGSAPADNPFIGQAG